MHFSTAGLCFRLASFGLLAGGLTQAQVSDTAPVTKYRVFDVGGFGGTFSGFFNADYTGDDFSPKALNAFGDLAGFYSPTPTSGGSFYWSRSNPHTLPNLPNGDTEGSNAFGLNNAGLVVGASSYGLIDPNNGAAYYHAVTWTGRNIHDLGDLGGLDSWANYVNQAGLVVGYAYNTIPDPYSFYGNQFHATTWANGVIRDLGTLGGTDSEGWAANNLGSVIGISFTNSTPIPPFNQPQQDAFVWTDGTMTDLGNLGGVFSTPTSINAAGEIAVVSYDSTNQYFQSYLWNNGSKVILQSPGGNFNEALMLNDYAVSAGAASDAADSDLIAAVWNSEGQGKSLGTVPGDTGSIAFGINRHNVIVGGSGTAPVTSLGSFTHAFVWRNGVLQDLNSLVPVTSPLVLNVAYTVNDQGVIAGLGTNSAGDTHAFVLIPETTPGNEPYATAASAPVAIGSAVRTGQAGGRVLTRMQGYRNR